MAKKDVTNDEIMQALNQFAGHVDEQFAELKSDVAELKSDVAELKSDVAELKSDVNRIYDILDKHMARIEDIMQENSVQTHQQERLQRWIFQLADEAGVKLKYE
jgi:septal ring factor EnvC (AmiA/AmiB activator)